MGDRLIENQLALFIDPHENFVHQNPGFTVYVALLRRSFRVLDETVNIDGNSAIVSASSSGEYMLKEISVMSGFII